MPFKVDVNPDILEPGIDGPLLLARAKLLVLGQYTGAYGALLSAGLLLFRYMPDESARALGVLYVNKPYFPPLVALNELLPYWGAPDFITELGRNISTCLNREHGMDEEGILFPCLFYW